MYEPVETEILKPLTQRGYIISTPEKNKSKYYLTDDGEETLDIFNYMLEMDS